MARKKPREAGKDLAFILFDQGKRPSDPEVKAHARVKGDFTRVIKQMEDYIEIRRLVDEEGYQEAIDRVRASSLSQLIKEHLLSALESNDKNYINTTLGS